MNMHANDGFRELTEKEKQTLRMLVRGHDAKSIARGLGLSVHTIHERLRAARRKLSVSSSREAARLLLEAEGGNEDTPDNLGDMEIGEDAKGIRDDHETASIGGAGLARRHPRIILGVALMTFILGLLALAASTQSIAPQHSASEAEEVQLTGVARDWLTLLDEGRWAESYRDTTASFQKLNTPDVWAAASEQARASLGAVISRTFLRQENLPAPPAGYEIVKFRTRFANKPEAVETVSFAREGGAWRVAGVTIE